MNLVVGGLFVVSLFFGNVRCSLEPGIFNQRISFSDSEAEIVAFQRSAFKDTTIEIRFDCKLNTMFDVEVAVRSSPCNREFYHVLGSSSNGSENLEFYFSQKEYVLESFGYKSFWYFKSPTSFRLICQNHLVPFDDVTGQHLAKISDSKIWPLAKSDSATTKRKKRGDAGVKSNSSAQLPSGGLLKTTHPTFVLDDDGMYILMMKIVGNPKTQKNEMGIYVEFKHPGGYLSPVDWPLLPFYGCFCALYAFYGFAWLVLSFKHWRELLRIQFWIGAVIVLGMLEMAVFYYEYQTMNHTGHETEGAIEVAEIVSCLKRTLSFVLVIFVSVGFGVVKPRLGSTLHKVVAVGFVYFVLCSVEGVARVSQVQHDSPKQRQLLALPLILMQLGMCYWIFTSLADTMRSLRLRRNEIKLSLYRHFTNTLIFCVVASALFMAWSLAMHQFNVCLKNYGSLWLDIAIWHILFAVILLVIMILWRPSNNNQRYAFTPLLDNAEDEAEDDTVFNEALISSEAMKYRSGGNNNSTKAENRKSANISSSFEDDLKWVEQHIPSSLADRTLPSLIASDDEMEKTKMEISKMQ